MNCVVTTRKHFFIVLKRRLPPWQVRSQCLFYSKLVQEDLQLVSGLRMTISLLEQAGIWWRTNGCLIFHCRTPHVPVLEADSHPASLPLHTGTMMWECWKQNSLHYWNQEIQQQTGNQEPLFHHLVGSPQSSPKDSSSRLFSLVRLKTNTPTPMKNLLSWFLCDNVLEWVHFYQQLLSDLWAKRSCWSSLFNLIR